MKRSALSLLELVVVLFVLVILAALVVPMVSTSVHDAELDATYATMSRLRDGIMGSAGQPGYFPDMKGLTIPGRDPDGIPRPDLVAVPPRHLIDLVTAPAGAPLFDPQTRRGWRGPYATQTGSSSLGVFVDSYQKGSPIVLQWPTPAQTPAGHQPHEFVRLVSFGADGQPSAGLATWDIRNLPAGTNPFGDDVVLYIRRDLPGMDWTNYWLIKQAMKAGL